MTTQAEPAGLLVDAVSVDYDSTRAVDGIELNVAPGEVIAVIGPSGCGKSTLLRAIAGLEPLADGSVWLAGRNLASVPAHQRDMGLMFQDHVLFPHLDVGANVAFGLRMRGQSSAAQRDRAGQLLSLVGLEGFEGRAVDSLSGGEAQRVALARALAPEPSLLMLDEPLGSLDRVLREQLTGDLRRLLTELDQTSIHVTHDQAEAFALADRVAVLRDGRLIQIGAPEELWSAPSDRFVAGFVGHTNIWDVMVDEHGAIDVLSTGRGEGATPCVIARRSDMPLGRHGVVVPHPALELRPAPDSDDAGGMIGQVTRTEFRGSTWLVELQTSAGLVEAIVDTPVHPGDRHLIVIDPERLIVVDEPS